jgi:hypothetical protein
MSDIDVNELLKKNPGVDRAEFERVSEMIRRFRESGGVKKGYNLAPPHQRTRVGDADGTPQKRQGIKAERGNPI